MVKLEIRAIFLRSDSVTTHKLVIAEMIGIISVMLGSLHLLFTFAFNTMNEHEYLQGLFFVYYYLERSTSGQ